MKNIKWVVLGIFIPFALVRAAFSPTYSPENNLIEPKPYLIEVITPEGAISEYNGVSRILDPFLIAKEFGSDPFIEDHISTFPDIKMGIGSKITIYRAPTYYIFDGKKALVVRSWANSVGELLDEKEIELGEDDKINFTPDMELINQMEIRIVRVAKTIVRESESIDFKTIKQDDKTLDKGRTKVKQAGKKGERKLSYLVVREDGEEISRTLTKTELVSEPVDEILLIGTKPVITVKCKFNDTVLEASGKYGVDPNEMCNRMIAESRGNPESDGGKYKGLFQYEEGFWKSASAQAGFGGASIWDARAQIFTTAWAWSHGLRSRWP